MLINITLGWCVWDLPALLVLLAMALIFVIHHHGMKKREAQFEKELARRDANHIAKQDGK